MHRGPIGPLIPERLVEKDNDALSAAMLLKIAS